MGGDARGGGARPDLGPDWAEALIVGHAVDRAELLLAMEDIEHRNTKVRSPRTNGFVERMNRTLREDRESGAPLDF